MDRPTETPPEVEAILRAADHLGSVSALSRALDCSYPSIVWNWIRRGRCPAAYARKIEDATMGAVSCADLRPDLYAG